MRLPQLDEVDKAILNELMEDPKKPFQKIAEEIGVAPVTAQTRYEKMRKKGTIRGTFTIVDLTKIGFQGKGFLFVKASKDYDSKTTIEFVSQIPNVFQICEIIGTYDLLVMVVFRNMTEIQEIVDKIRTLKTIEKVETSLTNAVQYPVKEEYTRIQLFENKEK
jgi:Lrp/AsnC family transcriptional regulator, regulator for asnA, asnC and gidA